MKLNLRISMLIVCGLCLLTGFGVATAQEPEAGTAAKDKGDVLKIIRLVPNPLQPDAVGIIRLTYNTKKQGDPQQEFEVIAVNLKKGENYYLLVDGAQVTSRAAVTDKGEIEAVALFQYSSKMTKGKKEGNGGLPAELDPVTKIKNVQILDSIKQVVLQADLPQ